MAEISPPHLSTGQHTTCNHTKHQTQIHNDLNLPLTRNKSAEQPKVGSQPESVLLQKFASMYQTGTAWPPRRARRRVDRLG